MYLYDAQCEAVNSFIYYCSMKMIVTTTDQDTEALCGGRDRRTRRKAKQVYLDSTLLQEALQTPEYRHSLEEVYSFTHIVMSI